MVEVGDILSPSDEFIENFLDENSSEDENVDGTVSAILVKRSYRSSRIFRVTVYVDEGSVISSFEEDRSEEELSGCELLFKLSQPSKRKLESFIKRGRREKRCYT